MIKKNMYRRKQLFSVHTYIYSYAYTSRRAISWVRSRSAGSQGVGMRGRCHGNRPTPPTQQVVNQLPESHAIMRYYSINIASNLFLCVILTYYVRIYVFVRVFRCSRDGCRFDFCLWKCWNTECVKFMRKMRSWLSLY